MSKFTTEQISELNDKLKTPEEVLQWGLENIHPKLALASSFGAEDVCVIHMLSKINPEARVFSLDTGRLNQETYDVMDEIRKKYKKIITVSDNIRRADWHAWEGKHWDVQRMLRYLPKDETALYRARQLLVSRSYGVDNAIAKVPAKYKNDIGLKYDRLKWRRRRGRLDPSLEILFSLPKDPIKLVRPDLWWKERSILTRSLIYKKKYAKAYKVSSNHSLIEGPEYADSEWLSGWIALTFLNDPNMALQHFKNFYNNVGYPISLSRGAYWIARTYKKIKNKQKSDEWFNEAAKYLNTYYGQLAFVEIRPGEEFCFTRSRKS